MEEQDDWVEEPRKPLSKDSIPPLVVYILFDRKERDGAIYQSARVLEDMYKNQHNTQVFRKEFTKEILEEIKVHKSRRLLVHYIGHGVNTGRRNYPSIPLYNTSDTVISLEPIHASRKNRDTLIIIYDCCNYVDRQRRPFEQTLSDGIGLESLIEFAGYLWLSSAQKGEYAYFAEGKLTYLTYALQQVSRVRHDSWRQFVDHLNVALSQILHQQGYLKPNFGPPLSVHLESGEVQLARSVDSSPITKEDLLEFTSSVRMSLIEAVAAGTSGKSGKRKMTSPSSDE
jgi:hypothetical protein